MSISTGRYLLNRLLAFAGIAPPRLQRGYLDVAPRRNRAR